MRVIELTEAEASQISAEMDAEERRIRDWARAHGVKSMEALVLDEPPRSDVDAD